MERFFYRPDEKNVVMLAVEVSLGVGLGEVGGFFMVVFGFCVVFCVWFVYLSFCGCFGFCGVHLG